MPSENVYMAWLAYLPCTRRAVYAAVYMARVYGCVLAVYDGRYSAVRHVHTSTPQLKGRVRAMYTVR